MTAQPPSATTPQASVAAGPQITLTSFGFKHGSPPEDPQGHGGFLFDCRALPNPFWDEALRPFSGQDARTAAWLTEQPEVEAYLAHALALVRFSAETYRRMERPSLFVAFGCTGGFHRSVFMAERVAERLRAEGYAVALQHRDVGNALASQPL